MPVCRAAHGWNTPAVVRAGQLVGPFAVCLMFTLCSRVIYNEVIQTSKYYMRDVTAIESAWLLELAPHFYQQGTVGVGGTWPQTKSSLFLVFSLPKSPSSTPVHREVKSSEPLGETTFMGFIGSAVRIKSCSPVR